MRTTHCVAHQRHRNQHNNFLMSERTHIPKFPSWSLIYLQSLWASSPGEKLSFHPEWSVLDWCLFLPFPPHLLDSLQLWAQVELNNSMQLSALTKTSGLCTCVSWNLFSAKNPWILMVTTSLFQTQHIQEDCFAPEVVSQRQSPASFPPSLTNILWLRQISESDKYLRKYLRPIDYRLRPNI